MNLKATHRRSPSMVASLLLALAAGCGSGDPWPPPNPDPECRADQDCEAPTSSCEHSACVDGACVRQPAARGTACDDGLFCTDAQVCDGRGMCGSGSSPCNEYVPGIPRCNEDARECEVCSDGRPLVNGECRCPWWNCVARGGATYCAETDLTRSALKALAQALHG